MGEVSGHQKTGSVSIKVPPGGFGMDPVGFAVYATQFLQAAQSIPKTAKFTPVPYYVLCRALELILKAFLLAKGIGQEQLRRRPFGHNLEALWRAAKSKGLMDVVSALPGSFEPHLAMANSYYKGKGFEYFDFSRWAHSYADLPPLDRLEGYTMQLIADIKPYCLEVA